MPATAYLYGGSFSRLKHVDEVGNRDESVPREKKLVTTVKALY